MISPFQNGAAKRRLSAALCHALLATTWIGTCQPLAAAEDTRSLLGLSLEDLMQIEVTSVTRNAQRLDQTAAAVYVITAEDIANSSAVNVPDLLRTVPGLEVGQIDANKWAVSARGFNGRLASKMLVFLDGRSLYVPTYATVFWESEDLLLEHIERIEIIRGPGAAIWGANAVNGVINITTRKAGATQGSQVSVLAGAPDNLIVGASHGGRFGDDSHYRLSLKARSNDGYDDVFGRAAEDAWESYRLGLRVETEATASDSLSFNLEGYNQNLDQRLLRAFTPGSAAFDLPDAVDQYGFNLWGRWEHRQTSGGRLTGQLTLDKRRRSELYIDEHSHTYDLDLVWNNAPHARHQLTVGGGARVIEHRAGGSAYFWMQPEEEVLRLYHLSLYDSVSLDDRNVLGFGFKLENNIYTGTEYMANVSLSHALTPRHSLWVSTSRAVRTPSRGERDGSTTVGVLPASAQSFLPADVFLQVVPTHEFDAEVLHSLEGGWRFTPASNISADVSVFFNQYDELRGIRPLQPYCVPDPRCLPPVAYAVQPLGVDNLDSADTWGMEGVLKWRPAEALALELGYSWFEIDYQSGAAPGLLTTQGISPDRDNPLSKLTLEADWRLDAASRVNAVLRYVSKAGVSIIPSYVVLDLQYVRTLAHGLRLSVAGRNLGEKHQEYIEDLVSAPNALIEPGYFLRVDKEW